MALRNLSRALIVGAVLAVCLAPAAGASDSITYFGEQAKKYFLVDADTDHPKKHELLLYVQEDYRDLEEVLLVAEYERGMDVDEPPGLEPGSSLKAVVHVLRDGKWKKVGKLNAQVFLEGDEAYAEALKHFAISLEPGDMLRFRFTCKNFARLLEGGEFAFAVAVIR